MWMPNQPRVTPGFEEARAEKKEIFFHIDLLEILFGPWTEPNLCDPDEWRAPPLERQD